MNRLLEFGLRDSDQITGLRGGDAVPLGMALARTGCSVEAAALLRPCRKLWAKGDDAETGQRALDAVAWWNKNWRDVARAGQARRHDEVLQIVGERFLALWDQPALLLHLSAIARDRSELTLSRHILERVRYLCERGMPKMDMTAFRYACEASLVDILVEEGDPVAAREAFDRLTPNPGNAMAHQLQGAEILTLSGRHDAAMAAVAEILVTAATKRTGWSSDMRRDFVETATSLAPLRSRDDWRDMVEDPQRYLAGAR